MIVSWCKNIFKLGFQRLKSGLNYAKMPWCIDTKHVVSIYKVLLPMSINTMSCVSILRAKIIFSLETQRLVSILLGFVSILMLVYRYILPKIITLAIAKVCIDTNMPGIDTTPWVSIPNPLISILHVKIQVFCIVYQYLHPNMTCTTYGLPIYFNLVTNNGKLICVFI